MTLLLTILAISLGIAIFGMLGLIIYHEICLRKNKVDRIALKYIKPRGKEK